MCRLWASGNASANDLKSSFFSEGGRAHRRRRCVILCGFDVLDLEEFFFAKFSFLFQRRETPRPSFETGVFETVSGRKMRDDDHGALLSSEVGDPA